MTRGLDRKGLPRPGGTDTSRYIGSAAMPSTGPLLSPEVSADHANLRAVVIGDLGDIGGLIS